jgi:hypothetical protein
LVSRLSQLNFGNGPVTAEQVEKWKQSFKELTEQGAAAVPAIREFLEKNLEIDYPAGNGGNPLGHASLRSALIDALQQIGGPEATETMLQTLQSTTLPSEIAQLARYLDQQAPQQYRPQAMAAAREVMAMAAQGQLPKWDLAPLFQMYQGFGDATVAAELETHLPQWKYYANMSSARCRMGKAFRPHPAVARAAWTRQERFPLQMLPRWPPISEAGAALLEQAALGNIPIQPGENRCRTGGRQFQSSAGCRAGAPPGGRGGIKTYHIESGNQNFPASSRFSLLKKSHSGAS